MATKLEDCEHNNTELIHCRGEDCYVRLDICMDCREILETICDFCNQDVDGDAFDRCPGCNTPVEKIIEMDKA